MKKMVSMTVLAMVISQFPLLSYGEENVPQTPTAVSRNIIQETDIPGSDEELRLMLVEFPPGYISPAHTHPVVGLNYIIEGTAESQYEGEDILTLNAGDSYQDPANKKHLIFRNPSKTHALRFLVAYKIKKDGAFMHPL